MLINQFIKLVEGSDDPMGRFKGDNSPLFIGQSTNPLSPRLSAMRREAHENELRGRRTGNREGGHHRARARNRAHSKTTLQRQLDQKLSWVRDSGCTGV